MPKLSNNHQALPKFDLKAEREKRDLTQLQVSQILFTTQSSIARWEDSGDMPQIHREYWRLYWESQKSPKKAKKA